MSNEEIDQLRANVTALASAVGHAMKDVQALRERVDVLGAENSKLAGENTRLAEHVTALEERALRLEKHAQDQNARIASLTTHAQIVNTVPAIKARVERHVESGRRDTDPLPPAPSYPGDPIFRDMRASMSADRVPGGRGGRRYP